MLVVDIIRRAAFNSGVTSSFNPNDVPSDIMEAGFELLSNEILPSLNCDRMLDVTVIAREFTPAKGEINLVHVPRDWDGIIVGKSGLTSTQWLDPVGGTARISTILEQELGITPENAPRDQIGKPTKIGIWCSDNILIYITPTENEVDLTWLELPVSLLTVNGFPVNLEFPAMRVEQVYDSNTRIPYRYLYVEEFESNQHRYDTHVYCVQEFEHMTRIRFKTSFNGQKKLVLLPVPLVITPTNESVWGEIKCPAKFRQYLVDALAVRLAVVYGLSTVDSMRANASTSYNLLKKNVTQELHPTNVNEKISQTLNRNLGNFWRIDGFI